MTELVIMVILAAAVVAVRGTWEALKLIWRLILWATRPIRDEVAFQRVVKEERQKEERIIEAHREAVQQIDNAAAFYLDRQEQALAQSDDESGRRQSGPSSEDTMSATQEADDSTHEPPPVVGDAPEGYYWLWYADRLTGKINRRAGRRKIAPRKGL